MGISVLIKMNVGMFYLAMIMSGMMTSPDQLPGKVNKTDLQYLSGAIQIENGDCDKIMCPFLTGVVIMNRLSSTKWNGNTIEEVILAKDGGGIQYATVTRNNFKTKKATDRTKLIAKFLLLYYEPGLFAPTNVVFQGRNKRAGKDVYWTDGHGEYFCYGSY